MPGYVTEFTKFWAAIPDVKRIWFSLYTPQKGEQSTERLRRATIARASSQEITELLRAASRSSTT